MYVSDTLFGENIFSLGNLTRCFSTKGELVYKNSLQRSVLQSQYQNPRNLDEKDGFFHTIHTKTTSNSQWNKN